MEQQFVLAVGGDRDEALNFFPKGEIRELKHFSDSGPALDFFTRNRFSVVLIIILKGDEEPAGITKRFREISPDVPVVPVLSRVTDEVVERLLQAGAQDCLASGESSLLQKSRLDRIIAYSDLRSRIRSYEFSIEDEIEHHQKRNERVFRAIIMLLLRLSEVYDSNLQKHHNNILDITEILAGHLSLDPEYSEELSPTRVRTMSLASTLHDLGNFDLDSQILLKTEKLTPDEFAFIKNHTIQGEKILLAAAEEFSEPEALFFKLAAEICRYHHERFDGGGYPEGLKGNSIPLSARIVALADIYDTLRTPRPYRPAWEAPAARDFILKQAGISFDPAVVDAFIVQERNIMNLYRD